jgi:protein-S-isoprenylcysteine O-methyltransferase Ste14
VPSSGSVPTSGARTFAWCGAALFAASLLYFLYTYLVTFGETSYSGPATWPVVWDVAAFSVFALHHSACARTGLKDWIRRFAGPGERSIYVWISSLLFIIVCACWKPIPGTAWRVDGAAVWALRVVQVFGVWLTLKSAAMIDILELAGVRQSSGSDSDRARQADGADGANGTSTEFKTSGPYGWVRHPIYAGWLLLVFSATTMTMTRLVFAATSTAYLLIAIPFEERSLVSETEGRYRTYMRLVRWRLVPGLF